MADKTVKADQKEAAEILECTIPPQMEGIRLDKVLSESYDGLSRSYIQKLFERGCIEVGGEVCTEKKISAASGQTVRILLPEPEKLNVQGEDIPLDIVYEDEAVLVVNKPAGMVVHPAPGNPSGTLVNDTGQRAAVPVWGRTFLDQRSPAAGHRPPYRQGYERPADGGAG